VRAATSSARRPSPSSILEWRNLASPWQLRGRSRREPSALEWWEDRSAEFRASTVGSTARNQPTRASSAADDRGSDERRVAASTSRHHLAGLGLQSRVTLDVAITSCCPIFLRSSAPPGHTSCRNRRIVGRGRMMERGANPRSVRQILFELVEDPTVRGQRRRYRRDRVFLAQYRQPPRERRPVTGLDVMSVSSSPPLPWWGHARRSPEFG
jgi:hypothetical protein